MFLTAQSAVFFQKSKTDIRNKEITSFQSVSYAQAASFAKVQETSTEAENAKGQSTEIQNIVDLLKQIEEILEPYRASSSELSHFEHPKKDLYRYQAA